jgi:hypothetical protein
MESVSNDSYVLAFFIAVFLLGWIGVAAFLSVMSGWDRLASRFRSGAKTEGEKFRFSSISIASGIFPINYGHSVLITVGRSGLGISLLLLFRLFHPPLLIPWSEIEAVRPEKRLLAMITAVSIKGFDKRILVRGRAGRKIMETYSTPSSSDASVRAAEKS